MKSSMMYALFVRLEIKSSALSVTGSRIEQVTAVLRSISCMSAATGEALLESSRMSMPTFSACGPSFEYPSMPPGKCCAITSAKWSRQYICNTDWQRKGNCDLYCVSRRANPCCACVQMMSLTRCGGKPSYDSNGRRSCTTELE